MKYCCEKVLMNETLVFSRVREAAETARALAGTRTKGCFTMKRCGIVEGLLCWVAGREEVECTDG